MIVKCARNRMNFPKNIRDFNEKFVTLSPTGLNNLNRKIVDVEKPANVKKRLNKGANIGQWNTNKKRWNIHFTQCDKPKHTNRGQLQSQHQIFNIPANVMGAKRVEIV